jgi:hypothetical protein
MVVFWPDIAAGAGERRVRMVGLPAVIETIVMVERVEGAVRAVEKGEV